MTLSAHARLQTSFGAAAAFSVRWSKPEAMPALEQNRSIAPWIALGRFDQRLDLRFIGGVAVEGPAADRRRHLFRDGRSYIRDDDLRRAGALECMAHRLADAAAAAGDDHDFTGDLHGIHAPGIIRQAQCFGSSGRFVSQLCEVSHPANFGGPGKSTTSDEIKGLRKVRVKTDPLNAKDDLPSTRTAPCLHRRIVFGEDLQHASACGH